MQTTAATPTAWQRWKSAPAFVRVAGLYWLALTPLSLWMLLVETNFFVSPNCFEAVIWPAVALSVLFAVATFFAYEYSAKQPGPESERLQRKLTPFTKWVLMPPTIIGFSTWVLTVAVPAIGNKVVGEPYVSTFTVDRTEHEHLRTENCYRVYVRELSNHWYGKLCVNARDFSSLHPGKSMKLYGTQSWFGEEIKRYSVDPGNAG
jgi:hypothetical protein